MEACFHLSRQPAEWKIRFPYFLRVEGAEWLRDFSRGFLAWEAWQGLANAERRIVAGSWLAPRRVGVNAPIWAWSWLRSLRA
jgi:hypothetical protein